MLSKGDWMYIKAQKAQGVYQKDIAGALGVHPKTVSRALRRGGAPEGKPRKQRRSKVLPYRELIAHLLSEGVRNGKVIYRILQEHGYSGKYTILSEYLRPRRPVRESRRTVRFETKPGRQLQSDWGTLWREVAGKRTRIHFIVNTLGYSRRMHFWCTDSEDAEHTYEGIIRSFEYLGGVTSEVLVDNQKAAVIAHSSNGSVVFNDRFADMAGHYGFLPKACRPYRARTKGKDERMVGYVKHNFFERYRSFESFDHMNQLAVRWLREEADLRVHGTVREVVAERFEQEAPLLKPLPPVRYDTSYHELRSVAWDGYVEVSGNRYSVPCGLCGKRVTVHIRLDGSVLIYDEWSEKVAEHRLRPVSEGWVTTPSHHAALWRETLSVEHRDLSVYEEVASCS